MVRLGHRERCMRILRKRYGYRFSDMTDEQRDYLIGMHFPRMRPWLRRQGIQWWRGGEGLAVQVPL